MADKDFSVGIPQGGASYLGHAASKGSTGGSWGNTLAVTGGLIDDVAKTLTYNIDENIRKDANAIARDDYDEVTGQEGNPDDAAVAQFVKEGTALERARSRGVISNIKHASMQRIKLDNFVKNHPGRADFASRMLQNAFGGDPRKKLRAAQVAEKAKNEAVARGLAKEKRSNARSDEMMRQRYLNKWSTEVGVLPERLENAPIEVLRDELGIVMSKRRRVEERSADVKDQISRLSLTEKQDKGAQKRRVEQLTKSLYQVEANELEGVYNTSRAIIRNPANFSKDQIAKFRLDVTNMFNLQRKKIVDAGASRGFTKDAINNLLEINKMKEENVLNGIGGKNISAFSVQADIDEAIGRGMDAKDAINPVHRQLKFIGGNRLVSDTIQSGPSDMKEQATNLVRAALPPMRPIGATPPNSSEHRMSGEVSAIAAGVPSHKGMTVHDSYHEMIRSGNYNARDALKSVATTTGRIMEAKDVSPAHKAGAAKGLVDHDPYNKKDIFKKAKDLPQRVKFFNSIFTPKFLEALPEMEKVTPGITEKTNNYIAHQVYSISRPAIENIRAMRTSSSMWTVVSNGNFQLELKERPYDRAAPLSAMAREATNGSSTQEATFLQSQVDQANRLLHTYGVFVGHDKAKMQQMFTVMGIMDGPVMNKEGEDKSFFGAASVLEDKMWRQTGRIVHGVMKGAGLMKKGISYAASLASSKFKERAAYATRELAVAAELEKAKKLKDKELYLKYQQHLEEHPEDKPPTLAAWLTSVGAKAKKAYEAAIASGAEIRKREEGRVSSLEDPKRKP